MISKDAILMNKAKELGLEKFVKVEASSYYLKEKVARGKPLGLIKVLAMKWHSIEIAFLKSQEVNLRIIPNPLPVLNVL
jgi:hypothetical protein